MGMENNYSKAKTILRQATKDGLVLLKYYNTYKTERSIKVIWWCRSANGEDQNAAVNRVHEQLKNLTLRTTQGSRGDIYSFPKES